MTAPSRCCIPFFLISDRSLSRACPRRSVLASSSCLFSCCACTRTVRVQGHPSMEKPFSAGKRFLKLNATFLHGGRTVGQCRFRKSHRLFGTSKCDQSHLPPSEQVDATMVVAFTLTSDRPFAPNLCVSFRNGYVI